MNEVLRVLQVEDSESDAALIVRILEKAQYAVHSERVEDEGGMRAALARESWDVIIADYHLPQFDGPAALQILHDSGLDIPFIVVSGNLGEGPAVAMMKAGAHDYLMKDNLARLAPAVEREIREADERRMRKSAQEDLRASEARYRDLADFIPGLLWSTDTQGESVDHSRQWYEYTGKTLEESRGQGWEDIVFPGDVQRVAESWQQSLRTGKDFSIEYRIRRAADGAYRWHAVRARLRKDERGGPLGWFGISIDIDDRKQSEGRIAHLASFPEANPSPIVETNQEGKATYANPAAKGRFPDLLERGAKHPLLAECSLAATLLRAQGERTAAREVEIDDSVFLVNILNAPEMGVIRAYCVDITNRKRSEEARRRSEERLSSIIGSAMDAIISVDQYFNIVVFNHAAEDIFCCSASEAYGRPIDRFLPARFRDIHRDHIKKFGAGGITRRTMYSPAILYGLRTDGEEFPLEATISQASNRGGQKLYTVILRDITQRKQSEEVARMYAQSKELDQLKTEFFANISHELRTPLTLILGPVKKRLASSEITEGERRDLELVERNARLLLRHVKDLLDLSKLDAGKMKADYTETDLASMGRLVASNFNSLAKDRGFNFTLEIPASLPVEVDTPKVERIIVNLLSNAFKFTPAGGSVRFAIYSRGDRAIVEVGDTGPGIPPDLREAIFERFRQVDSGANRRFGGTGLGLSIVKQFVNLHGGSITVGEEQGGHGSLFQVELPLQAPSGSDVQCMPEPSEQEDARQAVEELTVRSSLRAEPPPELPTSMPLVLVVEDNPDMNAFLTETLSANYRTASAFDGSEGLKMASELRPDLILSDMMMPIMSGDQLVRELRKREELDNVPIVLLTAKADEQLLVRSLKEGAQEYLQKPFVAEQLLAKIERLIVDRKRMANEMERLRDLSGHLLQADDQERREIAHELHEDVAQNLAALRMRLSLATTSDAGTSPAVHRILEEGLSLLELCCSGISAMSIALHPSVLDHFGLEPAISGYAKRFAQIEGIHLCLDLRAGLGRLPSLHEVTLFRIMQDALTNIRTSGGKEVTVRLLRDAVQITLEVIHEVPEQLEGKATHGVSAVGITAMRERVRILGGRLEIATIGNETTVRATIPLDTPLVTS